MAICKSWERTGKGGFSLLELLITVALMAVMYTMLLGPSSKWHQEQQMVRCARNLQLLHVAMGIFATDHGGAFPASPGALVPRYTADDAIFTCPGRKNGGYAYYRGRSAKDGANVALMSDAQVHDRSMVQKELLFSEDGKPPGNNHRKYGGNILFCDGRIEASGAHAVCDLMFQAPVILENPTR